MKDSKEQLAKAASNGDPIGDRPKVTKVEVVVSNPAPPTQKNIVIKFTAENAQNLHLPITLEFTDGTNHDVKGSRSEIGGKIVFETRGADIADQNNGPVIVAHSEGVRDNATLEFSRL